MVSQRVDHSCFGVIVEYNTSQQTQELTMSRKLPQSIRAFAVSFAVFAAVAIGIPAGLDKTPAHAASGVEIIADASDAADASPKVPAASGKQRQHRRDARNEMALPFFSFARVLRGGNGS
jgi:hypothetical protein